MRQRPRQSPPTNWIALACFCVFWCAIVGYIDFYIFPAAIRQFATNSYVATPAHIVSNKVISHSSTQHEWLEFQIEYTYAVDGSAYTGHAQTFLNGGLSGPAGGPKTGLAFPDGAERTCYYDPQNPSHSVLKKGIPGKDLMSLMFLSPFNIIAGLCLNFLVSRFFRSNEEFKANVTAQGPNRESFTIKAYGGIMAFFITLLVTTIVGLLAMAVLSGSHPTSSQVTAFWGAAFVISLATAIYVDQSRRAGRWDLTIDRVFGTVTLPAAKGRPPGIKIQLSDAKCVDVTETLVNNDDGVNSYVWRLHLETQAGVRYLIGDEAEEEKAREKANVLNHHLQQS